MVKLKDVKEFCQQVADAFASVLDYEVAIIDNDLEVVAGTGRYHEEISTQYGPGSMTSKFISDPEQRALVVENPKSSKVCRECNDIDNCPVWAVIMCPILFSGETIGSLSLMAFNEEQRDKIINHRLNLITFLRKVSGFIASTLAEKDMKSQITVMANEFKAVINSVHEGIIAINGVGEITHINKSAENILQIGQNYKERHINQLFSNLDLDKVFEKFHENGNYFETEIEYSQGNKKLSLLCNITLIEDNGEVVRVTISFRKLDEIKELANKIIAEDNRLTFDKIKGTSKEIVKVKKQMQRVARTDSTILIRGESGTGKSMFARAIHEESDRSDGSFINVNCAAIPESLLESELFGYEEGAFTGAKKGGKPGKFEIAHGGTIFLDEIGDMPIHFQVKLLKVIESKQIERVGGVKPVDINVRIIAATHQDLEKMVEENEFRKDLFYRLNVIPFYISPLRERGEDVFLLLHFFLEKYSRVLNKRIESFTAAAKAKLLNYSWPGNVRELENTIEYAVNLETSSYITERSLPDRIPKYQSKEDEENQSRIPSIAELEKKAIIRALKEFGTSSKDKEKAAEVLGISRATLYRKIKKFDINRSHYDTNSQKDKMALNP
jgi:transcriptional regulator with PAS, ATPase and Fis domain